MQFAQAVDFFLSPAGATNLPDIHRLANQPASEEADALLLGYAMEGIRLAGTFGSYREAAVADTIIEDDGHEVHVRAGDRVFVSFVSGNPCAQPIGTHSHRYYQSRFRRRGTQPIFPTRTRSTLDGPRATTYIMELVRMHAWAVKSAKLRSRRCSAHSSGARTSGGLPVLRASLRRYRGQVAFSHTSVKIGALSFRSR